MSSQTDMSSRTPLMSSRGRRPRDLADPSLSLRMTVLLGVTVLFAAGALAPAAALSPLAAEAAAPKVKVKVVGPKQAITNQLTVTASSFKVKVGNRRCKVAAATPLAALSSAARRRGFKFKVRDYGSCSATNARSSSQLFVYKIANHRNRGQDGWVYKVDGRLATNGAADLSGPLGSGLLHSGDSVVWFYCYLKSNGKCR